MAENCAQYLIKGSLVFVEGKLTTRKWQDQQGHDRYSTDIQAQRVQFLDRRQEKENGGDEDSGKRSAARRSQRDSGQYDDLDPAFPSEARGMDDVPF